MDKNERSTCWIMTVSRIRRQTWERIFGTAVLPVMSAGPHPQEVQGEWGGPARTISAFDLDLRALHPGDRARLAAYAARKYGWEYETTLSDLDTALSYPIEDRGDIEVVEVETARPEVGRPFLFPALGAVAVANYA